MPKVSLGLPVYNGEEFLQTAIEAVIEQTFADFELIISDNASTDKSQQICEKYAAQDSRIRYIRQENNIGAAGNFNYVQQCADGEYFRWVAHDDKMEKTCLEKCVAVLDNDPSVICAHTRVKVCDQDLNVKEEYDFIHASDSEQLATRIKSQIRGHQCYEIFGLFRNDILNKTPSLGNYFAGDAVLLVRLVLQGRFHEIPEPLFFSRQHEKQSEKQRQSNRLQDYMEWFDPSHKGQITLPYWRVLFEYLRSIFMYPMTLKERGLFFYHIGIWAAKRRKHLSKDVFRAIAQLISGLLPKRRVNQET